MLQLGQLLQDLLLQNPPSLACRQDYLDLHLEESDRGDPGADVRLDERRGGAGGGGGGEGGCGRRITVAVTAATALLCSPDHSTPPSAPPFLPITAIDVNIFDNGSLPVAACY